MNDSPFLTFAALFGGIILVGYMAWHEGYDEGHEAGVEDGFVSADYAFQAGAMWQGCGGFYATPENLTTDCRAWFTSFCEDHPALAKDGCTFTNEAGRDGK